MNKIFKEAAVAKYDSLIETGKLYPKKGFEKESANLSKAMKELKNLISDNEVALKAFQNLDSVSGEYEAYTEEQSFMRGFMEGVKFLNKLHQDLESLKEDSEEELENAI